MPDDAIRIREVRPVEYGQVGDMIVAAYATNDDAEPGHDTVLRDIASRVATSQVLVAESAGEVLGTVTYVRPGGELAEIDDDQAATIRMLGVSPAARGRDAVEATAG